jgi:hypothetical protein
MFDLFWTPELRFEGKYKIGAVIQHNPNFLNGYTAPTC